MDVLIYLLYCRSIYFISLPVQILYNVPTRGGGGNYHLELYVVIMSECYHLKMYCMLSSKVNVNDLELYVVFCRGCSDFELYVVILNGYYK